jgi:hypothetical protein
MFAGEWRLQPAEGVLPVVVARTQQEFKVELVKAAKGRTAPPIRGAAFYLWTNRPLNPCLATLEPAADNAAAGIKVSVDEVLPILQHELTHQLAWEMSKFASDNSTNQIRLLWSVEAIANYMFCYELSKDGWALTRPRIIPMGDVATPGAFAFCQENLHTLPSLQTFFSAPDEQFPTEQNYLQAATVAYFLLEGKAGKYRSSFLKLLELVHRMKSSSTTLTDCFVGVDPAVLQQEWESFVRSIRIDS